MDNILPTSFSTHPTDPHHNGHRPALLSHSPVDDRTPYEAWTDSIVQDPAWYCADTITQQTTVLEADIETEVEAQAEALLEQNTLLPGFETLTWADLDRADLDRAARTDCTVSWCIHQGLSVHSDGFDPDPDNAPHRSVEHTIRAVHGGESTDHAGRAEVTVQLEQDHDQATNATVTLAVVVRGIEQYAWLTLPETRALQHALTHLLAEAQHDTGAGPGTEADC